VAKRGPGSAWTDVATRAASVSGLVVVFVALSVLLSGAMASAQAEPSGAKTLTGTIFGLPDRAGEDEDRLDPDRPHFPEASTTVGKGRVMLESGYTWSEKGGSTSSHSVPEGVLRIGLFADWFELRAGDNLVRDEHIVGRGASADRWVNDVYLGVKLAVNEQWRYLPRIAVVPQMTIPFDTRTGQAGPVLPGLNIDGSWDVVKSLFNLEFIIATNRVRDDAFRSHVEVATGLTAAVNVHRDLEIFVEWDAFYAAGRAPRDYAVTGLVYFITRNVEIDARVGLGLNRQANDVLAGTGFAVRY